MFSKAFRVIREGLSRKDVVDRAGIVEDVLFGKFSSHDIEAVRAVAELTTALCSQNSEGMFDGGFFIFFKVKTESGTFQIFYKRLGVGERAIINDNPTVLLEPRTLLQKLESARPLSLERAAELRKIAGE